MFATMAAPASFAERLGAALEAAHMSQAELARRLGVRAATVSSWFAGRTTPKIEHACRLARVLRVPLESLCEAGWHAEEDGADDDV